MIEQSGEYARALVVEHAVAGCGGTHALHHHVEEQRLELTRRILERTLWILGGVRAQIAKSLGIGGEAGVGDGGCGGQRWHLLYRVWEGGNEGMRE